MSQTARKVDDSLDEPEPTWEIAYLFPAQGSWTEAEYLALQTNHLVEFTKGHLEFLPMPTPAHQRMVLFLYGLLLAHITPQKLGEVLVAPIRVRVTRGKYREPDVVFLRKENANRAGEQFWMGADLVMEVVSGDPDDRRRDLEEKPVEYARAGIREYWIVDPQEEKITVLRLKGKSYVVHGEFGRGAVAASYLLPGFCANVSNVLTQQLSPMGPAAGRQGKRPPQR